MRKIISCFDIVIKGKNMSYFKSCSTFDCYQKYKEIFIEILRKNDKKNEHNYIHKKKFIDS
jgi:hypothetical protein